MSDEIKISIIIWTKATHAMFFRDCVESILASDYRNFELVILDENQNNQISSIARELFGHDGRLSYHRLKAHKGLSYALNVGLHRKSGNYVYFLGQHDRISPDALSLFVKEIHSHPNVEVIYSDRDELIGINRMNPAFLPDFNVEYLRHTNYIGDSVLFSVAGLKRLGTLKEQLESAAIYDLLLRSIEKKAYVRHIPRLLFHKRIIGDETSSPQNRRQNDQRYREHVTAISAHLHHMKIPGRVTEDRSREYWRVHYDGGDALSHRKEYIVVHERGVEVRNKRFVERMYGIMRQKDVGIVGVRYEKRGFLIDNCGYIFDEKGLVYPACHNQPALSRGYLNRAILPHDVSMVDQALFMIDSKALERVGGFDRRLTGRTLMLDLCLKVRQLGLRVVFDPGVVAKKKTEPDDIFTESSTAALYDTWKDVLINGDPYYNRNLPMGLENYFLYA